MEIQIIVHGGGGGRGRVSIDGVRSVSSLPVIVRAAAAGASGVGQATRRACHDRRNIASRQQ